MEPKSVIPRAVTFEFLRVLVDHVNESRGFINEHEVEQKYTHISDLFFVFISKGESLCGVWISELYIIASTLAS